ncbi:hypothetical protein BCR34DRAFT_607580 [Clohesyomyces aquaticus]|uniref:PARP-type domain-containing protein n=1 Tax=Clohesyomyces aquaticus TaxID=1231657 RepID=A0A1Y1YFB1_9PLEO|nr:hypothetical protein BCR34DRAFT_607580 [Clohesyomyces aquaticus]
MATEEIPKFRLEHSVSDKAGCQQAACKREKVKVPKGELRLGLHQWHEMAQEEITVWRHWRCVPPTQLKGVILLAGEIPENVPGFSCISPESQEEIRLAFEAGKIVNKDFSDIRKDLVKGPTYVKFEEITDAVGYKVEVTTRAAAKCRGAVCKPAGIKIAKGELRLGIATLWGEHESWCYKHWKCATPYDLQEVKTRMDEDSFEGLNSLPEQYKTVVMDSIEQGKATEPTVLENVAPKAKRAKKFKPTNNGFEHFFDEEDEEVKKANSQFDENAVKPETASAAPVKQPKGRKKRVVEEVDTVRAEVAPSKKKRGRPKKTPEAGSATSAYISS